MVQPDTQAQSPSIVPTAMAQEERPSLSPTVVWVLCLLLTPLCGAVLYYAWRRRSPAAARHANRASWASFVLWSAISGVAFYRGMFRGSMEVTWSCQGKGATTIECTFTALEGRGEMCFDVVLTCGGRKHVAPTCSGELREAGKRTVDVSNFDPPIDPTTTCKDLRYENKHRQ